MKKGYKDLSVDHKPDLKEEKARIEEAGLTTNTKGDYVVANDLMLNMSRSIGDFAFK